MFALDVGMSVTAPLADLDGTVGSVLVEAGWARIKMAVIEVPVMEVAVMGAIRQLLDGHRLVRLASRLVGLDRWDLEALPCRAARTRLRDDFSTRREQKWRHCSRPEPGVVS